MFAASSPVITSSDERGRHARAATLTSVEDRSAGIDVLRGLCVLLVVLHHIHLRFVLNKLGVAKLYEPAARVLFWSGYFAVITFFVVSGYLITSMSLRRWSSLDRLQWKQFYRLRFARIAPCLLLLVIVLSGLHLAQAREFVIGPAHSLGRVVVAALTVHVNWLEGHHGYLPGCWDVLWSLSVEEVFYLSFPVLCLVLRRVRWLLVPLLALVIIGPFNRAALAGREPWQEYAYLSCTDGIAFGCLAALLAARLNPNLNLGLNRRVSRVLLGLGVLAVLWVVVFRRLALNRMLSEAGLDISILELGVALMLLALSQGAGSTVLARGTGWLRWVGRCSYEVYLTHMLVILGLMPWIRASAAQLGAAWLYAWYVVLLGLSLGLGWLVHRFYSEPLNDALRSRSTRAMTPGGHS